MDILKTARTRNPEAAQNEQALLEQVPNNAGGFVFEVTPETQLRRFLILGTNGGTYYQGEKELTKENAAIVLDWAENRTRELVDIVVDISLAGRAPKQNPTIFALAAAAGLGNDEGRAYALAALDKVARTGTHLFLFATYVEQFRGWGRGLRTAVGGWYESKEADQLAYQMVKYRQRNGWSHRDLLRLTHPAGADSAHKALYAWATKGDSRELVRELPPIVNYFLEAQNANSVEQWVPLIGNSNLSWEMLPDAALTEPGVWAALLDKGVPQTALMRQLPRLTNLGLLKGSRLTAVAAQLTNQERLAKARVHPMNVLLAQKTYAGGYSLRGSSTWSPVAKIVDALDEAFYLSFKNVEPANKRTLNALDVSGSMGVQIAGCPITAREASAAMSLVTVATEPEVTSVGFTSARSSGYSYRDAELTTLPISARQRLDDVVKGISGLSFGGTDCALPMTWALKEGLEFDSFIVSTDSETWAGAIHPYQALRKYREATGIPARLIVVGYTATEFSIADPRDNGMLDVVGLDSATPGLIADFSAGRI